MRTLSCTSCGAEVNNGLALCEPCQAGARVYLEFVPTYFRNLARWRPGRAGSRQVPGSRVLYDGSTTAAGTGDRIADRLDEAHTALLTWARVLIEDRPIGAGPRPLTHADAVLADLRDHSELPDDERYRLVDDPAEAVRLLCAGFAQHLTSIATTAWCGEFVRDLQQHEEVLRLLTEAAIPGWYAGTCRNPRGRTVAGEVAGRCGAPTYAVPGLSWVTCGVCGDTTHVGKHLSSILEEAMDWVAAPRALAEAVVALVDTEVSVTNVYARIRKWDERETIKAVRRTERGYTYDVDTDRMVVADNEVGKARYRLGDVLERVWARRSQPKPDSRAS